MVAKTLFLVLLGAAFVLASPVVKEVNKVSVDSRVIVENPEERSISEIWKKLEEKFSKAIDAVKAAWERLKQDGEKIISDTNVQAIKDKGIELIRKAKEVYKAIVIEGKEAKPEIDDIVKSLKELGSELKQDGSEAWDDVKKIVEEVVDSVKAKVSEDDKKEIEVQKTA